MKDLGQGMISYPNCSPNTEEGIIFALDPCLKWGGLGAAFFLVLGVTFQGLSTSLLRILFLQLHPSWVTEHPLKESPNLEGEGEDSSGGHLLK